MSTAYQYDEQGIYVGSLEFNPDDALPPRSTSLKPPKTTGKKVAQWAGGVWVVLDAAPAPFEPTPDWMALIAARRWAAETGGIVLAGMPVDTDDRSKLLINGAALRASRDSNYTLRWKTVEGFIDLPSGQVLIMADAVSDHVQACFTRESELQAAVVDGSITAEMLEQGWPA